MIFGADLHVVERVAEVGIAEFVEPDGAGSLGEMATTATPLSR